MRCVPHMLPAVFTTMQSAEPQRSEYALQFSPAGRHTSIVDVSSLLLLPELAMSSTPAIWDCNGPLSCLVGLAVSCPAHRN